MRSWDNRNVGDHCVRARGCVEDLRAKRDIPAAPAPPRDGFNCRRRRTYYYHYYCTPEAVASRAMRCVLYYIILFFACVRVFVIYIIIQGMAV